MFYWGTTQVNNIRLNQKIMLTNLIAEMLFLLNIPFVVLNYLYFPSLFAFAIVFPCLNLLMLFLNYRNRQQWSRLLLSGIYPSIYLIYHASLIPSTQHFVILPYFIQIGLWLPAYLVYDFHEKNHLLLLSILFIISAISLPFLNHLFEFPIDIHILSQGLVSNIFLLLIVLGIFGCIVIMKYLNHRVELKNENLLSQLIIQKESLEKSFEQLAFQQKEVKFMIDRNKSNEAILLKATTDLKKKKAELTEKNRLLEEREHEIESQNEELKQQQEELKASNEHLTYQNEEMVKQKKLIETQKVRAEILVKSLEKEVSKHTYKLQTMLDDMTKQNEDLKQFSYIISHNIRSPIAQLLGLVNIFDKENMNNPFNQEVLHRIEDSSKNLDTVIRDLTQMIAIRNNLNKSKENINIKDLVAFEKNLLRNEIEDAQAILVEDITEDIEVFSIKSYIQSILHNLLSNAIKYRANRRQLEIKLIIRIEGRFLSIEVTDNGLGLEMNQTTKEKIFGLYQRMHDHVNGKGLGLYMVKAQVDALGGKIEVQSELNKGSAFKVLLPINK